MPPDATPAAQADAFAALLDALGIARIDVIAVSAGATSALQLALRHPDKVKHLAVLQRAEALRAAKTGMGHENYRPAA
jgi:pimeloyl-ACP methyl ester carboxylesterase